MSLQYWRLYFLCCSRPSTLLCTVFLSIFLSVLRSRGGREGGREGEECNKRHLKKKEAMKRPEGLHRRQHSALLIPALADRGYGIAKRSSLQVSESKISYLVATVQPRVLPRTQAFDGGKEDVKAWERGYPVWSALLCSVETL